MKFVTVLAMIPPQLAKSFSPSEIQSSDFRQDQLLLQQNEKSFRI